MLWSAHNETHSALLLTPRIGVYSVSMLECMFAVKMNNRWNKIFFVFVVTGIIVTVYVTSNKINVVTLPLPIRTTRHAIKSLSNYPSEHTTTLKISDRQRERLIKAYEETVLTGQTDHIRYTGYALGWHYYEGQTCAARNLVGLQRWATSLNFGVVEPFVQDSHFTASIFSSRKSLRLRDYFDINVWNHKVVTTITNGTPLVSWEHFIKNAARQVIIVYVKMKSKTSTTVYVDDEIQQGTCFSRNNFNNAHLDKLGFKVIRQVCFNFKRKSPLPIAKFNKYLLGPCNPGNVSIIFSNFPGVLQQRMNILETKYHQLFVDWLKPSKRVINDAKKYVDMFLGQHYVAVSLRAVKLALSVKHKHPKDHGKTIVIVLNKCVDEFTQVLSNVSGQHFMTIDLGTFGDPYAQLLLTKTTTKEIIDKMIKITYNNSWSQKEWENTFTKATNGISDNGYIASLQKEIVSHASSLVLAGGGSFQNSMIQLFKSQSAQKDNVIQACIEWQ